MVIDAVIWQIRILIGTGRPMIGAVSKCPWLYRLGVLVLQHIRANHITPCRYVVHAPHVSTGLHCQEVVVHIIDISQGASKRPAIYDVQPWLLLT